MTDFGDDAQAAEALFREEALTAAARPASACEQVIEDGRVVCADCGEPIPAARLAVVPGATRCTECQEASEE